MTTRPHTISAFPLKIIAIVTMTCAHGAYALALHMSEAAFVVLTSVGGITFPIMAYLITEGYAHTSRIRAYALRLGVFALIAQIPYSLLWGATGNVLFTLLIGLGLLYADEHVRSRALFFALAALGVGISALCDWAVIGPILIYLFGKLKSRGRKGIMQAMLVALVAVGLPELIQGIAVWSGVPLAESASAGFIGFASLDDLGVAGAQFVGSEALLLSPRVISCANVGYAFGGFGIATALLTRYNGTRGRSIKWLFYAYYPLHLMIIWVLCQIIA